MRRIDRLRASSEAGVSLVEVVVAMTIMSVMMAMFTTSMLVLFQSANKNESSMIAQAQIRIAFVRLEKEIRYASGISNTAKTGDPYVEYVTAVNGTDMCTQLRLNTSSKQLQRRTWVWHASPLVPSAWQPLASPVTALSGIAPFTFTDADATYNFQRLRIRLMSSSGAGKTATTKATNVQFTAINTSTTTDSVDICTEGRVIP
jgi:hypothetical protein